MRSREAIRDTLPDPQRNVTFWTAVVQEGLWAPYIGRSISTPEYTTGLPVIDESLDRIVFDMPAWSDIPTEHAQYGVPGNGQIDADRRAHNEYPVSAPSRNGI